MWAAPNIAHDELVKREQTGSTTRNFQSALRHALLLFTVIAPLCTFWQLTRFVQLAYALLAGLAAAASLFPRRLAIVQACLVALAIFSGVFGASLGLALTLWPATTGDGHRVMPIGQVMFGGGAGIVLGVAIAFGYFRALRQRKLEARYLFALAALLTFSLIFVLLS